jgi:RluA family pseudouridine synthase
MIESVIPIRKKYVPKGIEILYEDKDIIIIIKGADLLSVKNKVEKEKNAQQLLTNYIRKGNRSATNEIFAVHRLDRETTGIMIFAKSLAIREKFADQWSEVEKKYITLVHGQLKEKSGTIQSYLAESKDFKMHSVSDPKKGKLAITKYNVVKESIKFSLLEIDLLTGKKNQIRVHMSEQGNCIVGDSKYGKKKSAKLALHAFSIKFKHPFNKKEMVFTAETPAHITSVITDAQNLMS